MGIRITIAELQRCNAAHFMPTLSHLGAAALCGAHGAVCAAAVSNDHLLQ